jgi:hypothetical protein
LYDLSLSLPSPPPSLVSKLSLLLSLPVYLRRWRLAKTFRTLKFGLTRYLAWPGCCRHVTTKAYGTGQTVELYRLCCKVLSILMH